MVSFPFFVSCLFVGQLLLGANARLLKSSDSDWDIEVEEDSLLGRRLLADDLVVDVQDSASFRQALLNASVATINIVKSFSIAYQTWPSPILINRNVTVAGPGTIAPSIDVDWNIIVILDCPWGTDPPPCLTFTNIQLTKAMNGKSNHVLFDTRGKGGVLFHKTTIGTACYDWTATQFLSQFKTWSMLLGNRILGVIPAESNNTLVLKSSPFVDFSYWNTSTGVTQYGTQVQFLDTTIICSPGMPANRPPINLSNIRVQPYQYVCYNSSDKGLSYRGNVQTAGPTQGACQDWSLQTPILHPYTPYNFPYGGLNGPYCRNPEGTSIPTPKPSPWCYVSSSETYVACTGIPVCENLTDAEIYHLYDKYMADLLTPPGEDGSDASVDMKTRYKDIVGLSVGLGASFLLLLAVLVIGFATGRFTLACFTRSSEPEDGLPTGPTGRDILEDLTVARVFRFRAAPILVSRVGRQMGEGPRTDPKARERATLASRVWVANLDGNAVAVKRLGGWDDPALTDEDRARALMGILVNHPSSFVNYFGYCTVEAEWDSESDRQGHPPKTRLIREEEGGGKLAEAAPAALAGGAGGAARLEGPGAAAGKGRGEAKRRRWFSGWFKSQPRAPTPQDLQQPKIQGQPVADLTSKPMSVVLKGGKLGQKPSSTPGAALGDATPAGREESPVALRKGKRSAGSGSSDSSGNNVAASPASAYAGGGAAGVVDMAAAAAAAAAAPVRPPPPSSAAESVAAEYPLPAELLPPGHHRSVECWLISEFCDVGSLEDELGALTALWDGASPNWTVLLQIAVSVAKGLRFIHGREVFHGNLKPSNVLFAERGGELQVKMGDIAFSPDPRPHTPARYVAPEGVQSAPADIYALGVIIWEMIHAPWLEQFERTALILTAPVSAEPPTWPPGAPPPLLTAEAEALPAFPLLSNRIVFCREEFEALIARCCARKATERPRISEVLRDLLQLQSQAQALLAATGAAQAQAQEYM